MKTFLPVLTAALLASGMALAQSPQTGSGTSESAAPSSSMQSTSSGSGMSSGARSMQTGRQAADASAPSTSDFVNDASAGGMFEVEAGKLAEKQGHDKQIKAFGKRMVADHSKADRQLKAALKRDKKNGNLQPAAQLTQDQQQQLEKLKSAQGADFDKQYAQVMTDDHTKDVSAFQSYAQSGDDPKVKAFAKKTLPVIKKHLAMIKKIDGKLGVSASE